MILTQIVVLVLEMGCGAFVEVNSNDKTEMHGEDYWNILLLLVDGRLSLQNIEN